MASQFSFKMAIYSKLCVLLKYMSVCQRVRVGQSLFPFYTSDHTPKEFTKTYLLCTFFEQTLADDLKSKSGKLFPLQCDLSNQTDIQRVMEWIEKNLGAVDILINNAAINIDLTLQTGEMEDWKKVFDVNFLGLTCMTKEVLTLMKKKGKYPCV